MPRTPRSAHVGREALLAHAEGKPLAGVAAAHLDGCSPCRDALAETERLLEDLRAPALEAPPDDVVTAAIALFPARPPARLPLAERVLETLGRLVRVEGRASLATAGVRGGGASGPVRLLFASGEVEVDLEVASLASGRRLTGQALAPDGGPVDGLVWVERPGWRSPETPIGAHGIFHLEGVPDPPFDLVVDLESSRVRFPVATGA